MKIPNPEGVDQCRIAACRRIRRLVTTSFSPQRAASRLSRLIGVQTFFCYIWGILKNRESHLYRANVAYTDERWKYYFDQVFKIS